MVCAALPLSSCEEPSSVDDAADTYVAQGSPNASHGSEDTLVVTQPDADGAGASVALVSFSRDAIVHEAAGRTLVQAALVLDVAPASGAIPMPIEARRMTKPWSEQGATWWCAVDLVSGDDMADCTGSSAWTFAPEAPPEGPLVPYATTATPGSWGTEPA
ncbi:MAG: DNRLRE domain-containing protein, partial [Myxococcales bacterium]|nr:DNRLRE domain-containing protein [Myxococcales bacterium]